MGDFEDVERLQAGIREWLLRSARHGRHELRGIQAPAVLPMLCAAAFGPVVSDGDASPVGRIGVLSSVRADALAGVLGDAVARAWSAHAPAMPTQADLQREISRGVRQALDSGGVRSDIAMVLREIDAGGTMLRAAVEAGQEELQREVLAAVEAVSAGFGETEFMLADMARAAEEIQDGLHRQRRELRAAGEQARRQSADVGLIREELAVIERRVRQYLTGPGDPASRWTGGCPYRGLLPYDQAHEPVFFGRERLTAELAGTLAETGIVAIIGPPGAGKTSLLQAGLRPALSRGVQLPGSAAWPQVSMTPAARPLTELTARLASLAGQRSVLIIDQFEQVFAAAEPERAAFIEAVCAVAQPGGPALTVIAVRGDCWDRCAGYPELFRVMRQHQFVVGPMTTEGLRRVITGPAEASGLRVDPGLADAILTDLGAVGPEARVLPVLSQAMLLTWEKREGDRLTLGGYRAAGRPGQIARAVEIAAEAGYAGPREADPGSYPAVTGGERDFRPAGDRVAARGRWRRRTLAAGVAVLVLAALAGAGQAVRSARNTASQQRTTDLSARLAAQSTALDGLDPVTASLLAGAAWRISPTPQARYSLLQSLAQPVRGILAAGSAAVTALAHGPGGRLAAGYADGTIRLWDLTSHHLVSTATWQGAPLALAFTDGGSTLEVAAPGAVGAWNLASTLRATPARGGLGGSSPRASTAVIAVRPLPGMVEGAAAAFSPDGSMLATGGGDGNVRLWDPATQRELGAPMSSNLRPVDAVAFSPDGKTVAAASSDGTVQLWVAATRQEAGPTMVASTAAVKALAFSPDGRLLATGGQTGDVRLWDVAGQSQAGATITTGNPVAALAFDTSGTTLASAEGDGTTELWDPAGQDPTGAALTAPGSAPVGALVFGMGAAGAGVLATGGGNGTVRLWDPALFHRASAPLAVGTPGQAAALGGGVLAVSDGHGTVRLWDTRTGRRAGVPIATRHAVTGLAVSADGQILAVAAGGVQLWSTATGRPAGALVPASAVAVAVSPGGRTLATLDGSGKVRLWTVAGRHQAGAFMTTGGARALAFNQNGTTLATAGTDGTARLWDTATGQETGPPMTAGTTPLSGIAFSPDGTTLATAGTDGTARLWDTATGQETGPPMTAGTTPLSGIAFSPDGTTLATASADGTARLWDVAFPSQPLAAACSLAGRSLTPRQWAEYAGTQPFQPVCP